MAKVRRFQKRHPQGRGHGRDRERTQHIRRIKALEEELKQVKAKNDDVAPTNDTPSIPHHNNYNDDEEQEYIYPQID